MLKRIVTYSLAGVLAIAVLLTVVGAVVKKRCVGQIAPGVTVWGRDVSGMDLKEAETVIRAIEPGGVTELRCRFLPEMREEAEMRVAEINETLKREKDLVTERNGEEGTEENRGRVRTEEVSLTIVGNELVLVMKQPLLQVDAEATLRSVAEMSSEVKIWEWLYGVVTGRPFRIREAEPVFVWEETRCAEGIGCCGRQRSGVTGMLR